MAVASAGPCASLHLAPTDNHASTPPQAGCPSCRPTDSVKALKATANGVDKRLKRFEACVSLSAPRVESLSMLVETAQLSHEVSWWVSAHQYARSAQSIVLPGRQAIISAQPLHNSTIRFSGLTSGLYTLLVCLRTVFTGREQ